MSKLLFMVLNDGETYTGLGGCKIVAVDSLIASEEDDDKAMLASGIVAFEFSNRPTLWEQDVFQFPRLLAEIMAIDFRESQWDELLAAMDLESDDLAALFDRAQMSWERIKEATTR